MTIDVDPLLHSGVVVRVGSADLWTATRRPLSAGMRIGTEQPVCRKTATGEQTTRIDNPPDIEGRQP